MLASLEISSINGEHDKKFTSSVCDVIHDFMEKHALFSFSHFSLTIFCFFFFFRFFYFRHHCHHRISINHIKVDEIRFYAAFQTDYHSPRRILLFNPSAKQSCFRYYMRVSSNLLFGEIFLFFPLGRFFHFSNLWNHL